MWGNLAGRVAQNLKENAGELRGALANVADIVAPQVDNSSSDDEEYYDDEEEEEEYYEDEQEEYDSKPKFSSLGSFLQNALDDEEAEHQAQEEGRGGKLHSHERPMDMMNDDDDDEEVNFGNGNLTKTTMMQEEKTAVAQTKVVEPPPAARKKSPLTVPTRNSGESLSDVPTKVVEHPPPARKKSPLTVPAGSESLSKQPSPIMVPNVSQRQPSPLPDAKQPSPLLVPTKTAERQPSPLLVPTKNSTGRISPLMTTTVPPPPPAVEMQSSSSSDETSKRARADALVEARRRKQQQQQQQEKVAAATATEGTPIVEQKEAVEKQRKGVEKHLPPVASIPGHTTKHSVAESSAAVVVGEESRGKAKDTLPARAPPMSDTRTKDVVPPPKPRETASHRDTGDTEKEVKSVSNESETDSVSRDHATKQQHVPSSKPERNEKPKPETVSKRDATTPAVIDSSLRARDLEKRCHDLEQQLLNAERHIVELQQDAAKRMDEEEQWRNEHLLKLQQEQAKLVEASTEAAAEEHKRQMQELQDSFQYERLRLERQLREEQNLAKQQTEELSRLLQEAQSRVDSAEADKQNALARQEAAVAQEQKRQDRAVRMAEDKLAQTRAMLDERNDEVKSLKAAMKELKATVHEHREGYEEAEEEMDELHSENETLRQNLHVLQAERDEWKKQIDHLESQREKMAGLQMELRMLREERDRERAQNQSIAVNAESSQAELESERDAALALARDLEQQLKATLADLEVAHSDTERVMTANENLQNALEAFQGERDAELALLEEQRAAAEQATAAAHAAAIEATHEANEARMREVQAAADAAVKNTMVHVESLESKLEEYRKENFQLRRSLDEAISRLQTSQEDVIDRMLMKNILLDWFAKNGKGKRDVLEVMASLLHFTDEEKRRIHIGDGSGALGSIVGAVAAPLPPSKADMEHLQGDTVREKWVSFLLAETGDDEDEQVADTPNAGTQMNGESATDR